jgi:isoamylase
MLLAGDEMGRTQQGNNNAYCHDSPLTWVDWDLRHHNADLLRFTRTMLAFRKAHPAVRVDHHSTDRFVPGLEMTNVSWHGRQPYHPAWGQEDRLIVVVHATAEPEPDCVLLIANMHWEEAVVVLPAPPQGTGWHVAVDTSAPPPADCFEPGTEPLLTDPRDAATIPPALAVPGRTVLVLPAKPMNDRSGSQR